MKKAYIVVISTVTVLCIVIGTMAHVGGWFNGFTFDGSLEGASEYSEELTAFRSLDIEADVMSVTIKKGDRFHISYRATDSMKPKFAVKGETLVVTQPEKKRFFGNLFGNKKCEMTLTIPEGVQLTRTEFNLDVADLKIADLAADQMKIVTDVGNVEMVSCTGNRLEAESDVGNVDIRSSAFKDMEIESDVGNVYVSGLGELSAYTIGLSTDIGKVTVNGEKCKKQFNQTAVKDNDGRRLIVETDTGSIEIDEGTTSQ